MHKSHWLLSFALLVVGTFLSDTTRAEPQTPRPSPALKVRHTQRRATIQQELDANHASVKDLYELRDTIPRQDSRGRTYLEGQIQQIDARSDVLFEELDAIDQEEYEARQKDELVAKIERFEAEARQLRVSGHRLPAATRAAKAKSMRKALQDGSWKTLVPKAWPSAEKPPALTTTVRLAIELETWKAETVSLRKEVQALRKKIDALLKTQGPKSTSNPQSQP